MKIEQIPPITIPHQTTLFCAKPISETWNRYSNIIVVERKLIKYVWSVSTYWLSISNIKDHKGTNFDQHGVSYVLVILNGLENTTIISGIIRIMKIWTCSLNIKNEIRIVHSTYTRH